jgi:hypothetical protein
MLQPPQSIEEPIQQNNMSSHRRFDRDFDRDFDRAFGARHHQSIDRPSSGKNESRLGGGDKRLKIRAFYC